MLVTNKRESEEGILMDIKNQTTKEKLGGKLPMILSKLWVFLSLNYILSDLLSNMESSVLRGLLEGNIGGIPMTQGFLLLAGLSLEIPFLMVVLSAILPYKTNRFLNIGAAILMILYQAASFFIDSDTTLHYIFFSAVEILGNIVILLLASKWKR